MSSVFTSCISNAPENITLFIAAFAQPTELNPVHTSNNVEATLSKQQATFFAKYWQLCCLLLRQCCRFGQQCRRNVRLCRKDDAKLVRHCCRFWQQCPTLLRHCCQKRQQFRSNIRHCSIRQYCFDIVAGVDRALEAKRSPTFSCCCCICFISRLRFLSLQRLFWNQTRMTRGLSPVISTSCSFIRASGRGLAP